MEVFDHKIIGLLTDFGSKGQHYVASMKAVILKINSQIKIIDISHEITPYSILEASYILETTYKYFPNGTVFIIVVDPGVGTSREIIGLKINSNHYFIGPNNGIFSNTLIKNVVECIEIQNNEFFCKPTSITFHGRDIMAPTAAYLLSGVQLNKFGPKFDLNNLKKLKMIYDINFEKKTINCLIQYIDSFGNGTTNIPIINNKIQHSELYVNEGRKINISIRGHNYKGVFTSHFSKVPIKSLLFLVGSTGFLEISINQGNASQLLGFNVGDCITIRL
ncbi:MAG: S-adenosyl-l-methionine hydroxide adenosyltransferase family protein [Promethearchaeota archaeon]